MLLPALMAFKAQASAAGVLASKVYHFDGLRAQADGPNTFRAIFDGATHTGFQIALHATDLAPGAMPHPPHHHVHEEMFLIREGTLLVTIAGHESTLQAGDVAYVASGDEHGIRNTGSTPARYFVFEMGSDRS
jgi:mannose-6-phosphate isomerase-like protein (cupin superfamily)